MERFFVVTSILFLTSCCAVQNRLLSTQICLTVFGGTYPQDLGVIHCYCLCIKRYQENLGQLSLKELIIICLLQEARGVLWTSHPVYNRWVVAVFTEWVLLLTVTCCYLKVEDHWSGCLCCYSSCAQSLLYRFCVFLYNLISHFLNFT